MKERRITRAVVLAAGLGTRLLNGAPKPLRTVSGVPSSFRVLHTLEEVGFAGGHRPRPLRNLIRRTLPGDAGPQARAPLRRERALSREKRRLAPGRQNYIDGECLLTMSDHLYSPELPAGFSPPSSARGACGLAVDRDIERCFDIDGDQGRHEGRAHREIAKELSDYDAIDRRVPHRSFAHRRARGSRGEAG